MLEVASRKTLADAEGDVFQGLQVKNHGVVIQVPQRKVPRSRW